MHAWITAATPSGSQLSAKNFLHPAFGIYKQDLALSVNKARRQLARRDIRRWGAVTCAAGNLKLGSAEDVRSAPCLLGHGAAVTRCAVGVMLSAGLQALC